MEDRVRLYAEVLNYTIADIIGKYSSHELCIARQLIWKRLLELGYNTRELADYFSRSHSSIVHGSKRVTDLLEMNEECSTSMWNRMKAADYQLCLRMSRISHTYSLSAAIPPTYNSSTSLDQ